jgi:hypothetical protein
MHKKMLCPFFRGGPQGRNRECRPEEFRWRRREEDQKNDQDIHQKLAESSVTHSTAMADEFSSATPGAFAIFFGVATGTHNPPVGDRYGDYLTVRPHEPCTLWFSATSYALDGGTASSNINLRYVEFGRGRDQKCYYGWRNAVKAP